METLPGKDVVRNESSNTFWNPMFNSGCVYEDQESKTMGVAPHLFTFMLLIVHTGKDKGTVSYTVSHRSTVSCIPLICKKRAAMDVCNTWIGDTIRSGNLGAVRMPKNGGSFILTGNAFSATYRSK